MSKLQASKDFWKEMDELRPSLSHDFNSFEIAIATKVICGAGLDFDRKKVFGLLFDMATTNGLSDDEFAIQVKKIRQSIPNFLTLMTEVLDEAVETRKRIYQLWADRQSKQASLPKFGSIDDSDEVFAFIRNLNKDLYTFSEAERLVRTTRQTLKKYADEGLHGLITTRRGKSEYLTKEAVANYYRWKWEAEHGSEFERALGIKKDR